LFELKKWKLDRNTQAMIMAQCEHESAGFTRLEESFNYSIHRLMEVFPVYFKTIQTAEAVIAQGIQEIANTVYARRMGNGDKASGDGWRFRGRGPMMLTGKNNYLEAGQALKLDLMKNPDLINKPENAARSAILFFTQRPWLIKACKEGDVLAASSWINLGHFTPGSIQKPLGIEDRQKLFAKWLKLVA
jgi:putative chitinase